MRVSVIVPSYRRPASLQRCLRALARQDTKPNEIIVVARDDDEATRQVIATSEVRCRLVTVSVPVGCPGFVAALNAGVSNSTGDIVCFTDDDAAPRPDWIGRIVDVFRRSPSIGAVGGRDWIHQSDPLDDRAQHGVGVVTWSGRVIGNHHAGVGPRREVSVLKGANLAVRGELIRSRGFDTRLRGVTTEHHCELGMCLSLRRMGFKVIYDPEIAVDHYPQPREGESRDFSARQVHDAAHNETLALLEHLSGAGRTLHLLSAIAIGTRAEPGIARLIVTSAPGPRQARLVSANVRGRLQAIRTFRSIPSGLHAPSRLVDS
jgi:GT2 family glycosyltransferase